MKKEIRQINTYSTHETQFDTLCLMVISYVFNQSELFNIIWGVVKHHWPSDPAISPDHTGGGRNKQIDASMTNDAAKNRRSVKSQYMRAM